MSELPDWGDPKHTTPTGPDAADAAVLSDRDITVIAQTIREAHACSLIVGPSHQNTLIWLLGDVDLLMASHLALAAERDRYRDALEWYADPVSMNDIDSSFGTWQYVDEDEADWLPDRGERARSALRGAAE